MEKIVPLSPTAVFDGPHWDAAYCPDAAAHLQTSPLRIPDERQIFFFLGEMLASLHARGVSYTDLHTGNVGCLGEGGLYIIDFGGISMPGIDPIGMTQDFVVPALRFGAEDFGAFLSGYVFTASKLIDPVHPRHSETLASRICDADIVIRSDFDESAEIVARFLAEGEARPALDADHNEAALLAVILSAFNAEHESPPNLHGQLRRVMGIDPEQSLPPQLHLQDIASLSANPTFKDWLSRANLALGPISDANGGPVTSYVGRPRARVMSALVGELQGTDETSSRLRERLLVAIGSLVHLSCLAKAARGIVVTYLTIAFGAAAVPHDSPEKLEQIHNFAWRLLGLVSTYAPLSAGAVKFDRASSALELFLMFHKAATLDRMLFEASVSAAKGEGGGGIAWHAALGSTEANRKALLICFYALEACAPEVPVPEVLRITLSASLHLRATTELHAVNLAVERNCTVIASILGLKADLFAKGLIWAKAGVDMLESRTPTTTEALALLRGGLKHFAPVDLEVEVAGVLHRHSRQDALHGFGRAFGRASR